MIRFIEILFLSALLHIYLPASNFDLNYVRENYNKAVTDKKLCAQMMNDLAPVKSEPVCLAYLGGLQAIWANHVFNPLTKLNTFNEGKRNIENALNNEPNNVEIRFIRMSVQTNAPSFLRYHQQIKTDEAFIRKNLHNITNPLLLKMINELLNNKE